MQTTLEKETHKKTASFLGSAGASLVDLDDLFSSNPKPQLRPLANTFATQAQAIGKDRKGASLWVKKASCGIICGVLDSNGCMINLKDWKITDVLKISNYPGDVLNAFHGRRQRDGWRQYD